MIAASPLFIAVFMGRRVPPGRRVGAVPATA